MSELATEPVSTRTSNRSHPETHPAPQAPTRGTAPARGRLWGWWRGSPAFGEELPVLGGVTGGTAPGGDTARPRMRTPSASEAAV
jgi:hypothetical protein